MKIRQYTDTLVELAVIYTAILLVSGGLFAWIEQHSFLNSLYWAGTTATSTGYGDISPKTPAGQVLAFVLMHVSIFGVAPLIIVRLIERVSENRDLFSHEEQERTMALLTAIDQRLAKLEASSRPNS
jgi:voltage-gated potassium channel